MPVQNLGGFRLVDRRTVGAFSSCCWRFVPRAVSSSSWRPSVCTISSCSWKRWVCSSCSCCWRRIRPTSAPVPGEAGLAPSCAGDVSRAPPAAAAGVASGPPSPPGKLRSLFSCAHTSRARSFSSSKWRRWVRALSSCCELFCVLVCVLMLHCRGADCWFWSNFAKSSASVFPIAGCRCGNYSVLAACSLEAGLEPPSAPVWCSLPTLSPLGDALRARSILGDGLQAHWPLGRTLPATSHRRDVLRAPDPL
jgi:hypothetical protein